MCYSGKCVWEDYMGDCRFPNHIKEIKSKYDKIKCAIELNEYYSIQKEIRKIKVINLRKDKINLIKNKLFINTYNI